MVTVTWSLDVPLARTLAILFGATLPWCSLLTYEKMVHAELSTEIEPAGCKRNAGDGTVIGGHSDRVYRQQQTRGAATMVRITLDS